MIKALKASLLLASLSVLPAMAQDDFNGVVFPHKRCGTSIILEREAAAAAKGHKNVISASGNYVPHTGTVTIPVILVNFKDVKFTINDPQKAFDQFFNAPDKLDTLGNGNERNYGSVAKYYSDMSSGEFNLRFKVYAPLTLDRNETYYGGTSDQGGDENTPQLVRDAVDSLKASGQISDEDAASFSSDGKTIDCVYIIYAGLGQNYGGAGTTVWANTWNQTGGATIDGKSIRWYSMAGELSPAMLNEQGQIDPNGTIPLISGVGVSCHELGHAFGLPDFYTTNSSAYLDNQEMEYWDLMDGGEYSNNGFCPTAYTAFEKSEMGWPVNIEELTENQSVSMENSTEKGGTAYKIVNPSNANEYFMLECQQRRGWNRYEFGNGLLVYHVNRPSGGLTSNTRFNNTPGYPGMAVVPADGACLSSYLDANNNNTVQFQLGNRVYTTSVYRYSLYGDLFPGTGNMPVDTLNVTELSDAKPQPNFCWYNSAKTQKLATNKALRNITYNASTGAVSFDYINDVTTAIRNINVDKNAANDNHIYTIDGRYVGTNRNGLPKGIYIIGGKKVVF